MPIRPLACLVSACFVPAVLHAEPPDLVQFRVGAGIEHNTNVRRVGTGEQSDEIGVLTVGAKIDRSVSLQRFRADVEASRYRHNNLSQLDYSTLNYLGAWDWKLTPALHGVLSAERRQFRDISDTAIGQEIGRRTERTELFEGIYDIDGVWRAMAGVSRTSSSTTVPESWDASPTVRSARVGVGYEAGSGSSIFGRVRRGDGEYKQPLTAGAPADFREDEADVAVRWVLTGKTSLDGRLGYLKRTHDGAPQRDFSGPVGNATVTWDATGKTRVVAGYFRYLSTSGFDTGGHVESDRFFLGPVWRATAHISVNGRYERTAREWRDVAAGTSAGRRDVVQLLSLGVDWEPRRFVTVTGSVRGERVRSTIPAASYRNRAVGVGVRLNF